MPRSKSSHRWLKEHFADPYVKLARKEGYRSRAAFKLLEIQERDHLFKPRMTVIDLGAAPGSWTEVAKELVGAKGKIIALDILPMDPISGVEIIQGDFTEPQIIEQLHTIVDKEKVDLVISDMAPNTTGIRDVDQPRSIYLAELALDFALQVLKPKGSFLVKVFQGAGFDHYLKSLRLSFKKVAVRKPKASRGRSNEVYLLAKEMKV